MRLDLDGPPHRNPDDREIPCLHLHIYREGYGDKWASPAPIDRYPNVQDLFSTFEAFMRHCNITEPPQLKGKTTLRQLNGSWVEITTPYLDRHNDALRIYARRENDGFVLTDDSYIIHDLESSGCKLDTEKRKDLLRLTLNGFGVKLNEEAIEVQATSENFPLRKHNLIQAMLAVNDLFYLAKPVVESLFYEDVVAWLDANDIRYTANVSLRVSAVMTSTLISPYPNRGRSRSASFTRSTARHATARCSSSTLGAIRGKCGPTSRKHMPSSTMSNRFRAQSSRPFTITELAA